MSSRGNSGGRGPVTTGDNVVPFASHDAGLELLLAALDPDRDAAARKYEMLRRKTIRLLEWRGAWLADDLADETLTRVARKLAEGTRIEREGIEPFVRGVARLIFLEFLRELEKDRKRLEYPPPSQGSAATEEKLSSLDRCLSELDTESRELILDYYSGSERSKIDNRKQIASRLGVSPTALRLRTLRIRDRLESCIERCMQTTHP